MLVCVDNFSIDTVWVCVLVYVYCSMKERMTPILLSYKWKVQRKGEDSDILQNIDCHWIFLLILMRL